MCQGGGGGGGGGPVSVLYWKSWDLFLPRGDEKKMLMAETGRGLLPKA